MLMDIYMRAYFFTVRKSLYPGLFSAAQTSKVSAIDINYLEVKSLIFNINSLFSLY